VYDDVYDDDVVECDDINDVRELANDVLYDGDECERSFGARATQAPAGGRGVDAELVSRRVSRDS
jgi:hypothetical protein